MKENLSSSGPALAIFTQVLSLCTDASASRRTGRLHRHLQLQRDIRWGGLFFFIVSVELPARVAVWETDSRGKLQDQSIPCLLILLLHQVQ
jgi:hypothetical protein